MSSALVSEDVGSFAERARTWLAANLPRRPVGPSQGYFVRLRSDEEELARIQICRDLQRLLFEGGFAGICVPQEYGGQGLTIAHQEAFAKELSGYDYPEELQVPTFTPILPVLLDFGTEAQKRTHVPAMLKGEEAWMQFLSEPSSGSDVASALTSAVRDGDGWVLNGSKVWTSGAWWADWALCLARTNWDVPKHRGLTVFMIPIRQAGIEIHRIEMLNGSREFCQEFLTDVRVPDDDRVGDVDGGWTVGTRWMYHERTVAGGSSFITRPHDREHGGDGGGAAELCRKLKSAGPLGDRARELIGEVRANELVSERLTGHIVDAIIAGRMTDQAAAITRLFFGAASVRNATISFELNGASAVAWPEDDRSGGDSGIGYLMRQAACIGGGTTEMSRNVISERVLGMPRERTPDREINFRDVPRSTTSTH